MTTALRIALVTSFATMIALGGQSIASAEISENLLPNPSFEEGTADNGAPTSWEYYMGPDETRIVEVVEPGFESDLAVLIQDDNAAEEIGIGQTIPADGGLTYEAAVMVYVPEGSTGGGAYIQLRFSPGDVYVQQSLATPVPGKWTRIAAVMTAPEGTTSARIYLYTHREPTPKIIVDEVSFVSGVEPPPPPPPPAPEAIPAQYDTVKDLGLVTSLAADGAPSVKIVKPVSGRYDAQATAIARAINQITDVDVPIIADDDEAAAVPIAGNLICLGNRSTNATVEELYNRYYTLLDLRYPGEGGHVVRTLHDPFGDGANVVFVGGSDDAGVADATRVFIEKIEAARGGHGSLAVGRLAEIKLGDGIEVPHDINELLIWEASKGYRSTGYFGWCSISKRLAAYYMTGDEFHAKEFLRLSFPDEQALKDISDVDGERIENKDDPLAGFYHYNAHMAILFWDLVEESPFFTDEDRLKVTNAFARQLNHRKNEGIYKLIRPASAVGSRHGQYSAISLYCLGRYFNTYYPDPVWAQCESSPWMHFASLEKYAWVNGESDNLFWYTTGTAPILSWMMLSGDRRPLESGSLQILMDAQEMLISGRIPDNHLGSGAIDYWHKLAYVTRDGRWLEYRDRTGVDLDVFRLGQSFWPQPELAPTQPTDLAGKWMINPLPEPLWQSRTRSSGLDFDTSFQWGAFRNAPDGSGDYILLDGYNAASRNPYHTFAILNLRLDGATLLNGYHNQVLTRADGMVEQQVAMDGALLHRDVLGQTVVAVGDVPKAAYCDWQRSLVQRMGRYALVVDDLTFRTQSDNIEAQILWETSGASWDATRNMLGLNAVRVAYVPDGWYGAQAMKSPCTSNPSGTAYMVPLDGVNIMLLRATEPGHWLEMPFQVPKAAEGEIFIDMVDYIDRGIVRFLLDGEPIGEEYDHSADAAATTRVALGTRTLAAGPHTLRVEVVGKKPGSDRAFIGLGGLLMRPIGAEDGGSAGMYTIAPSKPVKALRQGSATVMQWFGAVEDGGHVRFFSLISPDVETAPAMCWQLAENAAVMALPQPALAVTGKYSGTDAELAVVATDHLYGHGLLSAGMQTPLITASDPVEVDWDFTTGVMEVVVTADPTSILMRVADSAAVRLNGEACSLKPGDGGMLGLDLPAGRHRLAGLKPADSLEAGLTALLEQGTQNRDEQLAAAASQQGETAPALPETFAGATGEGVTQMLTIPEANEELVCAAAGDAVHVFDPSGAEVRTLQADSTIRQIHWWPEHELLLVGCDDEQVIAFNRAGERQWVFVSEMDPAVFRAAKTYWFKSASTHKGVWGVTSGVFLEGKSQAFVGSACTLEIIDEHGKLVHRMPQFWGDPHVFRFIDGPGGSINLLAARRINGGHRVGIINNETLDPGQRGFYSVPEGHTYVGGWSSLNRYHLLYEDLDGDGVKEVISEVNGTWNRVSVWEAGGKAKWDASFGPGTRSPTRNMRDLLVADLDGDGAKEIITCTSGGLVVALSYECEKLWSKRLASPPNVMAVALSPDGGNPWLIVGCDDGSIQVLDGTGALVRTAKMDTRVEDIVVLSEGGPLAVIGSATGQVLGLRLE